MRAIAVSTPRDFWLRHPVAEQPLKTWYEEAAKSTWAQPADIEEHFRSTSILKIRRAVFTIKANYYQLQNG